MGGEGSDHSVQADHPGSDEHQQAQERDPDRDQWQPVNEARPHPTSEDGAGDEGQGDPDRMSRTSVGEFRK